MKQEKSFSQLQLQGSGDIDLKQQNYVKPLQQSHKSWENGVMDDKKQCR